MSGKAEAVDSEKVSLLPDENRLQDVSWSETNSKTMNTLSTIKTAPVQDKLITKKMAAQRLSVSTRTIDRMAAEGSLEKVFVGSAPRFRNSDIDRIIECGL